MTRDEAARRVAKGYGWWETKHEWKPGEFRTYVVYCARLKDGTTMRVRWP